MPMPQARSIASFPPSSGAFAEILVTQSRPVDMRNAITSGVMPTSVGGGNGRKIATAIGPADDELDDLLALKQFVPPLLCG